jgi:hypothetical protein
MLFSGYVFAQYEYRDSNRIGVFVGMNQLTLNTDSFDTKPDNGWNAGLSVRGNFYNNWDMVYAIQFSENNFLVATKNLVLQDEDVKYMLPSAQISLQFSYKIIPNHLSVEFGPIFQLNGKLKIDEEDENNVISGTPLLAKDIVEISKFNFYPVAGITFGVKHVRLNFSYQYGLFNTFGSLNYDNLGVNLKANPGIANGNLIIYF